MVHVVSMITQRSAETFLTMVLRHLMVVMVRIALTCTPQYVRAHSSIRGAQINSANPITSRVPSDLDNQGTMKGRNPKDLPRIIQTQQSPPLK